jgi:hypothetical protein
MPQAKHPLVAACALALAAVFFGSGGCGGGHGSQFGEVDGGFMLNGSGSFDGGFSSGDTGATPQCAGTTGWQCAVDNSCPSSSQTTLAGKVYDPAGLNPLYDVVVFIPKVVGSLPAITPGTHTCNTCDVSIGDYVAATTTDATGSFTLPGVPTGTGVPVTVQIGKWRRTVSVNIPTSCATTTVDAGTLRLPAKQSEGDLPQMAVLTGGCDDLGCFMKGMGIDASEFTAPGAGGRLDVYQGVGMGGGGGFAGGAGAGGEAATLSNGTAGNCTNASCPLWASKASFEAYDIVLLSCECAENRQTKPAMSQQALHDWLGEGGKVFASHYHYTWFEDSPAADFRGVANWGKTAGNDTAQVAAGTGNPYDVDTSFSKGATFAQWLSVVNALDSNGPPPDIRLNPVADSVVSVNPPTLRWIYASPGDTGQSAKGAPDVKYLSFGTPIGGAPPPPDAGPESGPQYCGKAVYTDLHTGGSLLSTVASIPAGCTGKGLSDQQKALEFLFFDLSACVSNDMGAPPPIPPPTQ